MRRRKRKRDEEAMSFFSFQDIMTCVTGIMLLLTLTLMLELLTREATAGTEYKPAAQTDITSQEEIIAQLKQKIERNREMLSSATVQLHISQETLDSLRRQLDELHSRIDETKKSFSSLSDDDRAKLEEIEKLKKENYRLMLELQELRKIKGEKRPVRLTLRQRQIDGKLPLWVELGENEITVNRVSMVSQNCGVVKEIARFSGPKCASEFVNWVGESQEHQPLATKFVLLVRPGAVNSCNAVSAALRKMGFTIGVDTWGETRRLSQQEGEK